MVRSEIRFRIFGRAINREVILQILVVNSVRVLERGLHSPTQFFWEYPPASLPPLLGPPLYIALIFSAEHRPGSPVEQEDE